MEIKEGLKYSKDHEWVKAEGSRASIGISDFAQSALGSIVFVELPEIGAQLKAGDVLGVAESVKAASDVYTPVGGKVVEINESLVDNPEALNDAPYDSWIAVIEMEEPSQLDGLMNEDEYAVFCEKEG